MKFMRSLICLLIVILLTACTSTRTANPTPSSITPIVSSTETDSANACPLTEPTWAKCPEDAAVQDPPATPLDFKPQACPSPRKAAGR
jgi:hypothetical protein